MKKDQLLKQKLEWNVEVERMREQRVQEAEARDKQMELLKKEERTKKETLIGVRKQLDLENEKRA